MQFHIPLKIFPKFHFQRGFPFGKTDDEVG